MASVVSSAALPAKSANANKASAAPTERLGRVVARSSTVQVRCKRLFGLSGAQMVLGW